MKLAKIPDNEAVVLLRELGLLVGQAGIYGPTHNVTQNAARSAFPALEQTVARYGAVEIMLREKKMLVNGVVLDVGGSSGKNLLDRMALHKIDGISFLPPLNVDEFLRCVTLFGTPPMALAAEGGFEEAMKKANLRSVQVVNVTYRRVSKDQAAKAKPEGDGTGKPRAPRRPAASAGVPEESDPAVVEARRQVVALRQQRATAMADMLRKAAALLEKGAASEDAFEQESILGAFNQIRDMLSRISEDTENQIRTLAGQVHADRKTIADIESAARRRGIGLKLTRNELVTRYSEISQEIAQPLTVSTGVIDLLNSGRAGELSESQRELLKMAAESVERVNRLVTHLREISGMPESLVPDEKILKDVYVLKPDYRTKGAPEQENPPAR